MGIMDRNLVQTWAQTKSSGMKLPEVHGVRKTLNRNSLPEKQKIIHAFKKEIEVKPKIGQGGAGVKHKKPQVAQPIDQLTDKLPKIPKVPTTQNIAKNRIEFPAHEQSISN